MQQINQSPLNKPQNSEVIEKIELFIQQHEYVSIPSIVFEYLSIESPDFDESDLIFFFEQFGEIEEFILNGKVCVVLFKTFFSANTCREFLNNEHNFINNMKKKDFSVRWFNLENDYKLINNETRNNYQQISIKNSFNLHTNLMSMTLNNINNNTISNEKPKLNNNNSNEFNINIPNQFISQNIFNDINIINILNQNNPSINMQNINYNNILNNTYNQKLNYKNNNNINEEKYNNGKLTCKYEILIPNDKDFQITRRLIGIKGYNMKKIIDECKSIDNNKNNDNENIKLRLRGKGSGFKEGINNKESDEPLHLCISTKNLEVMKKACECVNDLFNKIYDDYKIYCSRMNINPVSKIAKKIDGGKNCLKYSDFI